MIIAAVHYRDERREREKYELEVPPINVINYSPLAPPKMTAVR